MDQISQNLDHQPLTIDQMPTKEMADATKTWIVAFAQHGHFIEPAMAFKLASWWEDREAGLLLEGPAGGGKTTVAEVLYEIVRKETNANFYQVQCYKSIGAEQMLYHFDPTLKSLSAQKAIKEGVSDEELDRYIYSMRNMRKGTCAQALLDPADEVLLLFDEIDKIPVEEMGESLILEYLGHHKITVMENKTELKRKPGLKSVRSILTSNLGKDGFKEKIQAYQQRKSLSYPLLRRCHYIYVPLPSPASQYFIFRQSAPRLSKELVLDCVFFIQRIQERADLDKPISIAESKSWVRTLERYNVKELTSSVLKATGHILTQIPLDTNRMLDATEAVLKQNARINIREELMSRLKNDTMFDQIKNLNSGAGVQEKISVIAA
jgi:MoxR-like ATPase